MRKRSGHLMALGALYFALAAFTHIPDYFLGTWRGTLSGTEFQLRIWQAGDAVNATMRIAAYEDNLLVLGYKEGPGILYLFRPSDRAAMAVFRQGGDMVLEYWETGAPRRIVLRE